MKTLFIGITCCAFAGVAQAQQGCCPGSKIGRSNVIRDAATHESLAEAGRKQLNPLKGLPSVVVPEEAKNLEPVKPTSLIARSEVFHRGGLATLVPKQAVLHIPEGLRGTVGLEKGNDLVNWTEFYTKNRAWIRTVEVTRAQAEGLDKLPEDIVESFVECTQVVVATYQSGPISVLPVKEPEVVVETTDTEEL